MKLVILFEIGNILLESFYGYRQEVSNHVNSYIFYYFLCDVFCVCFHLQSLVCAIFPITISKRQEQSKFYNLIEYYSRPLFCSKVMIKF